MKSRNRVNTYAARITKMIADIEDRHHGPIDIEQVAVSSSLRLLEPKRTIESRAKRSSINLVRTQHPSETMVFHNEDGNPARANIKQALGYLKDGDGDGNSQHLRYQVVQIVLWYLDSGCSKHMTGNNSQFMNFVCKFLGKLDAKADIGIFVGYTPAKKAFRIYNKRTQKIIETIHVIFDELTAMASEQFSLGPRLHSMTPTISSSGLVPNPVSQQPCIPPKRDDWDHLFQPMFDEYFNPPSIIVSPVQEAAAPRAVVLADSPVSTSIDQDSSSTSIPST
ncbi:integrase, catalytic region, zinc finger, CCHC-type containing protein [Tanacetum coccineum]